MVAAWDSPRVKGLVLSPLSRLTNNLKTRSKQRGFQGHPIKLPLDFLQCSDFFLPISPQHSVGSVGPRRPRELCLFKRQNSTQQCPRSLTESSRKQHVFSFVKKKNSLLSLETLRFKV